MGDLERNAGHPRRPAQVCIIKENEIQIVQLKCLLNYHCESVEIDHEPRNGIDRSVVYA
jgi:hypothetical protein